MRTRLLATVVTAAVTLAAAPAALARVNTVGNSSGNATQNICAASIECTYLNESAGKPTDVVRRAGTLTSWSLAAGSVGGQVQLRILRPVGAGKLKLVHSSPVQTVTAAGLNTFPAKIKVKRGDVLALSNDTSGIYMAPAGSQVAYFDYALSNGAAAAPDQTAPGTALLLSAQVKY